MKFVSRLTAVALFTGLAACSSPSLKNIDRQPNIVGGTEVAAGDALANKVVLVLGTTATGGRGYCSGTVIDDDIVLTAAHCIDPAIKKYYVIPKISMSPDAGYDREKDSIPVTKWITNDKYVNEGNKQFADVALLKLERPVPKEYKPIKIYDGKDKYDPYLILAGYGKTDEKRIDATYLRFVAKPMADIEIDYKGEKGSMYMRNGDKTGACEGDSGGPVFFGINGEFQLAGVISTTFGPDMFTQCHGIVKAMYLPHYIPWIKENKAKLHAYPLNWVDK